MAKQQARSQTSQFQPTQLPGVLSLREVSGCEVRCSKRGTLFGLVEDVLFHPSELRALGLSIKPAATIPSFFGAIVGIRRRRRYVSLDALSFTEDGAFVLTAGKKLAGRRKRKKGEAAPELTWDDTVIYYGLPLYTQTGERLGKVGDGHVNLLTGQLSDLEVTASAAANLALGKRSISADLVLCFREGKSEDEPHFLLVKEEAAECVYPGGMAATAGVAAAKAGVVAGKARVAVGAVSRKAVRSAAKTLASNTTAQNLKKHVGIHAKGLWSAFSDAYQAGYTEGAELDERQKQQKSAI